jgi:hypothetical protein
VRPTVGVTFGCTSSNGTIDQAQTGPGGVVSDNTSDSDDPFENLTLDETFVEAAKVREEASATRLERLRRIDREHRELASERRRETQHPRRRTRRSRPRGIRPTRGWITVTVLVVLALAYYGSRLHQSGGSAALGPVAGLGALGGDATSRTVRISGGQPSKTKEPGTPLGTPAPLAAESNQYRFMETQADHVEPVAYDPCRPIHVVVNARTAPAIGDPLLDDALSHLRTATGLQISVEGRTDEVPTDDRPSFQPDRYGDRWAPVLVAWSDPAAVPGLAGPVAGLGGSASIDLGHGSVYLTGTITLDGPQLTDLLTGPDGYAEALGVVEHELGHLVGLAHIEDPTQLMNPSGTIGVTSYAAGDLTGLSRLGQGKCFPDV